MATALSPDTPLVSVVIPCYNHGEYLAEALESVRRQTYQAVEMIVVDDGSTDNTSTIARAGSGITYVYQENQGLSAARNTGVRQSKGTFLVFLDADDWLYPDAVEVNVKHLQQDDRLAFVSGGFNNVFSASNQVQPVVSKVRSNHYLHLLKGNYIGMHATVMYRRWVFDEFLYDTSLKACEDYDLYLRVTRKYPVLHHAHILAAYRRHTSNMSGNTGFMLRTVLNTLERQKSSLQSFAESTAYAEGSKIWRAYYVQTMSDRLQEVNGFPVKDYYTLLKYDPDLSGNTLFSSTSSVAIINQMIKHIPSPRIRNKLKTLLVRSEMPAPGKIRFGDLLRLFPFSTQFGYDRGGPVDRYYIENFLGQEAPSIRGNVLEIGDNAYTLLYGGDKVTKSDILHVDHNNPNATLVGDISHAPHIQTNTFDCIILTQTLHLIYNFKDALHTCYRILKPGGSLLLTVPGITPIDHGEWKETWYWSFTDKAMRRLMEETFPGCDAEVTAFGNVFTATAFLYGMGLPEIPSTKLMYNDPHYQVIVTVKVTKSPAN